MLIKATDILAQHIQQGLLHLYQLQVETPSIVLQQTKKEFEGDFTLVTFPYTKASKKGPEQTAEDIGNYLKEHCKELQSFNIVKGFLNLLLTNDYWQDFFSNILSVEAYGTQKATATSPLVVLEYSSPNTNKPLHLGHIRNNLLGWSVAEILKASGKRVHKTCIVNDRGVHICKSMLAWKKSGNRETPQSSGVKGDHLVGKYYVAFDIMMKEQIKVLLDEIKQNNFSTFSEKEKQDIVKNFKEQDDLESKLKTERSLLDFTTISALGDTPHKFAVEAKVGERKWKDVLKCFDTNEFENIDPKQKEQKTKELQKILKPFISIEEKIEEKKDLVKDILQNKTQAMSDVKDMLRKWEAGDKETIELWKMMNSWVYEGFDVTYKTLGVDFDSTYYESNTYLLGKDIIEEGLAKGVFFKKDDGSVWIDLTADKLDEKLVLRADGTSVYITQDIGTAVLRYKNNPDVSQMIYTVGNEQDYHFKVLFLILNKLGYSWAKECYHLSYGMVELPEGKMKSREGTVVDADDLLAGMYEAAEEQTRELGKLENFDSPEAKELYRTIGFGALKYFILKVDPKKKMLFDPKESIDLHGNTAPFIQYTYARTRSILRECDFTFSAANKPAKINLHEKDKDLIYHLHEFPNVMQEAAKSYSPALVANYIYDLAKHFNQFYNTDELNIKREKDEAAKKLRLALCYKCSETIKIGMKVLGIKVPERM